MITEKDACWAKVVREKYGREMDIPVVFNGKDKSSFIWMGLTWGVGVVAIGYEMEGENGKKARFWMDVWLEETNLASMCSR